MHASRLYSLTSICLLLLYGVVGVAGQSLHYVFASDGILSNCGLIANRQQSQATAAQSAGNSAGYFHCHGPDYHWHHHHGPAEPASGEPSEREHDRRAAWNAPQSLHGPHACPLLAIVATLKLGHGALPTPRAELAAALPFGIATVLNVAPILLRDHLARGPPVAFVA